MKNLIIRVLSSGHCAGLVVLGLGYSFYTIHIYVYSLDSILIIVHAAVLQNERISASSISNSSPAEFVDPRS